MLAPLGAVVLPFELSLVVQAAILLAVVLVFLVSGLGSLHAVFRSCPSAPRTGLLLYAGAAVVGVIVGVASGNPPRYVVSQAVAMLLLPAATLAGMGVQSLTGRTMTDGLGFGALVWVAIHALALTGPLAWLAGPEEAGRLALRYDQSVVGAATLACVLLAARVAARPAWWPVAGLSGSLALVVGSMSRGGWAAALLGGAAAVVLTDLRRLRTIAAWALAATIVVVTATAVAGAFGRSIPLSGATRGAPAEPPSRGRLVAEAETEQGATGLPIGPYPVSTQHLEIVADARGTASTRAILWVEAVVGASAAANRRYVPLAGSGQTVRFGRVIALPQFAEAVRFGLWVPPGQGRWELDIRRVVAHQAAAGALLRSLRWRAGDVLRAAGTPSGDETLRYRFEESRQVISRWRDANVRTKLMGQGLGATFDFRNSSWGPGGRRASLPVASYIHNFYLFLGFKLGVFGLVALLGLLLTAGWTLVAAITLRAVNGGSWLLAGSAAVWLAFLLWSVTSPEIYDFRVAPLLGLMVAACMRELSRFRVEAAGEGLQEASVG